MISARSGDTAIVARSATPIIISGVKVFSPPREPMVVGSHLCKMVTPLYLLMDFRSGLPLDANVLFNVAGGIVTAAGTSTQSKPTPVLSTALQRSKDDSTRRVIGDSVTISASASFICSIISSSD